MVKRKDKAAIKKLLNRHPDAVVFKHNDSTFRVLEMHETNGIKYLIQFKYSTTGEELISCTPKECTESSFHDVLTFFMQ